MYEYYKLTPTQLHFLLRDVAKLGAENALIDAGLLSPTIWRSDAIKLHGEKLLNKLERFDLIQRRQHYPKGNYYYDVKDLNAALVTENRHRYFKNDE